ncbi:cation-translocating P-type ATPase [Caenimonas sp. SL110]|uniref:heavy metal translocating P-type ATPase n=1 Tax=Caenimonas sp. SL110 TaxID=1450524 RepID=UPI00065442E0|nr:cation-translocating P-type ATPase [Caenimonas sp. SL110]
MNPASIALDDPREWESFSRAVPGREGWLESFLAIEGMHCAACALDVEDALRVLPGVERVHVNGATHAARLQWSPQASVPSQWLNALQRAGYGATPAGDLLTALPRVQERRLLLWRWLVAGFCMMQVMMYATPSYTAAPGEITPDIIALLAWASWVLTLPVIVFSAWPFFRAAFKDLSRLRVGMDVPVALGIAIAFAASSAATFDAKGPLGGEVWYDSVTMFVFFLLSGRLLEQRLRDRTAGSLEALMRRLPRAVLRQAADGSFEHVPANRLQPGDIVRLLPGETVPADGVVTEGVSDLDEALLTGESNPVSRRKGDAVIAGTHNVTGVITMRVEQTGSKTRYAGIVALMEQAALDKPLLAQAADRIAGPFIIAVIAAAAAAAMYWWPTDPRHAISVAIAVLVVTCPCALSLATPAATLAAAGSLARRGILVRRLQALDACAAIDTVVFDKTGTLTHEDLTVSAVHLRPGADRARVMALAGALASHSLHPASRAIASAAKAPGEVHAVTYHLRGCHEIAGSGVLAQLQEAQGAKSLRLGSAVFCGVIGIQNAASATQVHMADDNGWLATFELEEVLRSDSASALGALRGSSLRLQLLSGDNETAVHRIAQRAGLATAIGGCSPEAKLDHVAHEQVLGHRVLMVGDGVNDGPVLARADASVAMGQGAPLAQARADFTVPGGQLTAIPQLLRLARRTRRVVRQNLAWAAIYNAVCVPLAVIGAMPPWLAGLGMAASSLLVVANSARLSVNRD